MRLHMNMNVLELGRRMHLFWHYKNSPLLPSSFKMKPRPQCYFGTYVCKSSIGDINAFMRLASGRYFYGGVYPIHTCPSL